MVDTGVAIDRVSSSSINGAIGILAVTLDADTLRSRLGASGTPPLAVGISGMGRSPYGSAAADEDGISGIGRSSNGVVAVGAGDDTSTVAHFFAGFTCDCFGLGLCCANDSICPSAFDRSLMDDDGADRGDATSFGDGNGAVDDLGVPPNMPASMARPAATLNPPDDDDEEDVSDFFGVSSSSSQPASSL